MAKIRWSLASLNNAVLNPIISTIVVMIKAVPTPINARRIACRRSLVFLGFFLVPCQKVDRIIDGNSQADREGTNADDLKILANRPQQEASHRERKHVRNHRDQPEPKRAIDERQARQK